MMKQLILSFLKYLLGLICSFIVIPILIYQVLFSLCHNKDNILGRFLFYIRRKCEEDSLKVIGYSLFPCFIVIIFYVYGYFPKLPKGWEGGNFYSFVISVGALIVTILVAIKINARKIENNEQFYKKLLDHIAFLNYQHTIDLQKDQKLDLYIISPNINIGIGLGNSFADVIKNNKNIRFIFICKKIEINDLKDYPSGNCEEKEIEEFFEKKDKDSMLYFIYKWYHYDLKKNEDRKKLETSIDILREILDREARNNAENFEIIRKYENLYPRKKDDDEDKVGIGCYLSDRECAIGRFYKIYGKVTFKGETISSPELISLLHQRVYKERN